MKKILVAYDGGEPARRALDAAADLAQAFAAELAVISVTPWETDRFPVDIWDDAGSHEKALASAAESLRQRGLSADLLAPSGEPATTIEEVARAGGYDTIVVGSRNLGPVRRLIEGSVSERIATDAKATVVIAR